MLFVHDKFSLTIIFFLKENKMTCELNYYYFTYIYIYKKKKKAGVDVANEWDSLIYFKCMKLPLNNFRGYTYTTLTLTPFALSLPCSLCFCVTLFL